MVFRRFGRPSTDSRRSSENVEAPKSEWFKDEWRCEGQQGGLPLFSPEDDGHSVDPPVPPPIGDATERVQADTEEDWGWDLLGSSPLVSSADAQVIDDYILVEENALQGKERSKELSASEGAKEPCTALSSAGRAGPLASSASDPAEGSCGHEALANAGADGAAGPAAAHRAPAEKGELTSVPNLGPVDEEPPDETTYRCLACSNHIFKEEDILSSNYHAMTGPGYLTGAANNVRISLELQTQLYTTGKYTVREVGCGCCSAVLGVTYAGAADARNRYKVGKFLLGRDRLCLPRGVVHPMDVVDK